jgi:hypothetical protein
MLATRYASKSSGLLISKMLICEPLCRVIFLSSSFNLSTSYFSDNNTRSSSSDDNDLKFSKVLSMITFFWYTSFDKRAWIYFLILWSSAVYHNHFHHTSLRLHPLMIPSPYFNWLSFHPHLVLNCLCVINRSSTVFTWLERFSNSVCDAWGTGRSLFNIIPLSTLISLTNK